MLLRSDVIYLVTWTINLHEKLIKYLPSVDYTDSSVPLLGLIPEQWSPFYLNSFCLELSLPGSTFFPGPGASGKGEEGIKIQPKRVKNLCTGICSLLSLKRELGNR